MARRRSWLGLWLGAAVTLPAAASAQELADIDYEYLSFRGFGLDWGYMSPDRVEPTATYALRFDLGYAGPGLRITPSVTYWKSPFRAAKVTEFAVRIADLVADQTGGPPPTLDLGTIEYSDVALGLDGHVVWRTPFRLLTFGGMGVSAHFLNGSGPAIDGTFIEDQFDSVEPGFNLHFGGELPLTDRFRIYGLGRYEVMPDDRFFHVRVGWQIMTGPNAPGEVG